MMKNLLLILLAAYFFTPIAASQDRESAVVDSVWRTLESKQFWSRHGCDAGSGVFKENLHGMWSYPISPRKCVIISTLATICPIVAGGIWLNRENDSDDPDWRSPIILIVFGTVAGPSAGYAYSGLVGQGLNKAALRLFTVGIVAQAFDNEIVDTRSRKSLIWRIPLAFTGFCLTIGRTISDISILDIEVRKKNRRLSNNNGTAIIVQPKYFADSGASGLELNITF